MSNISEKLNIIQTAKDDIKTAIENKGVTVGNVGIQEYARKIDELATSEVYPTLQEKTVIPTTEVQEVTADEGIYGLSKVTVDKVNLQDKSVTPSSSEQIVKADNNYTGLNEVTVNGVPTQEKEVVPTRESQTIIPSENKFLSKVIVSGDDNLVSQNIVQGKSIFGVEGTAQTGSGGEIELNSGDYLFYRDARESAYEVLFNSLKQPTSAEYMYYNNENHETIDFRTIDFSKCTSLRYSFGGNSGNIEYSKANPKYIYFPDDWSALTNFSYMFKVKNGLTNLDMSNMIIPNSVNCDYMFQSVTLYGFFKFPTMKISSANCFLNNLELYTDTTKKDFFDLDVSNVDFSECDNFYSAFKVLTKGIVAPYIDFSKANKINTAFSGRYLENMCPIRNLGKNFTQKSANYGGYNIDFSSHSNLTHDSLMNIINGLYDLNLTYNVANGGTLYTQKLTLGATNIAKLTAEEIAIATNKGWTVA